MQKTIENHHLNKKEFPELTVAITRKEHQKIHNQILVDTELSRKMRQYDAVTKMETLTFENERSLTFVNSQLYKTFMLGGVW